MINKRYVNHRSVWCHDKDVLIDSVVDKLDSLKLVKNWDEKSEAREALEEALSGYTLYRCSTYNKTGVVGWRILYCLLVVFQWLLWPYCFFNWLLTGNFKIDSNSRLGMILDRIVEQAT
ncbi:hypothetical protein vBVpaS1601_8 [Vibrio phage vB_VpaS_1601]|uniref:hypothetical protein n=1 Tax=Vibrio phage SHOU24 TaxID=1414739 RepID=UPI0003ED224B|nr:hypothetical protein SHOU24_78 [Vibrio phage SHOU24]AHI61275.1 hypothetical protein SHOU24_78 [Vibrio phage SHOU24]WHM52701.1 hypothetical protein vBVpaP1601_8 [Vibrio phage vB_VpaP_1601]